MVWIIYIIQNIMASIGTNVESFIKGFGMTGNSLIDTMILANVIPMLVSYSNTMMALFNKLLCYAFEYIKYHTKTYLASKFMGTTLCKINICDENNKNFYTLLKTIIFDKDIDSDEKSYDVSNFLNSDDDEDGVQKKNINNYQYYNNISKWENTYDSDVNYQGDTLLQSKKKFSAYNECKKKVFKHNGYIIRVICKIADNNRYSHMKFELISMKDVPEKYKLTQDKYILIIEDFMKTRLNVSNMIEYVYNVTVANQNLQKAIATFVNSYAQNGNGFIDVNNNGYADMYEHFPNYKKDVEKEKFIGNKVLVKLKTNTITASLENHVDQVEITENNNAIDLNDNSFSSLYSKYNNSKQSPGLSYGYFYIRKNKIILLHRVQHWHMTIVSHGGLLSELDVKNEINEIIRVSLNKNTNENIKEQVCIHKYTAQHKWSKSLLDIRSFDTIYLPTEQLSSIKLEIEKFVTMEKLYRNFQIPYRKGMLFYGPPGTGKTSLVKTLAYEFQLNIYVLNVNDEIVNDDTIVDILNSLGGGNKILLFEDIDTAFSDKEKVRNETRMSEEVIDDEDYAEIALSDSEKEDSKKDDSDKKDNSKHHPAAYKSKAREGLGLEKNRVQQRKFLTYSGLLNAIDGPLSSSFGLIILFTTNHIEMLGDALLREGRMDCKFELGFCNTEQVYKMAKSFITRKFNIINEQSKDAKAKTIQNPSDEKYMLDDEYLETRLKEFANALVTNGKSNIKPCELQAYLLRSIEDIDALFDSYHKLLKK